MLNSGDFLYGKQEHFLKMVPIRGNVFWHTLNIQNWFPLEFVRFVFEEIDSEEKSRFTWSIVVDGSSFT